MGTKTCSEQETMALAHSKYLPLSLQVYAVMYFIQLKFHV